MDAKLLIVDPESGSRDALTRFFSRCGFRVETALDGLECVDKIDVFHPDVVLANVDAPWGDAAASAALDPECSVAAFLVMGEATPPVLSRRTGVSESFCFSKPLRLDHLLDQVGLAVAMLDLHARLEARRPFRQRRALPVLEAEACLN